MIDSLTPYPAYKDSDLPWLGQVPAHWELRPASGAFIPNKERNQGMKQKTVLSLSYGRIVIKPPEKLHGLVPESFETYQIMNPGDIVLRTTDLQNDHTSLRVGMVRDRGIITSAYLGLRVNVGVNPEFAFQFLNVWDSSKAIYGYGSGLRQNLDFSDFKRMPIPLPPPAEQAAIVRFLEWAGGRLERTIRAKRRIIALLNEQKQAIIHRAVTRGLDPTVPLKDSGIPWLGEIPAHWEVRRLRHLIKGRLTYGANAAAEFTNPDWPRYIRITDFRTDGTLRTDTFRSLPPNIASEYAVAPGDILFARSGATVGKAFLVKKLTGSACHAGYLIRARPDDKLAHPEYLFTYTQSKAFTIWKDSTFNTSTIQNIGADKYANLPIPLPSLEEQKTILMQVDTEQQPLTTAISRLEREIELLREYRTRLISDVVTGKLDVRAVAASLPAELAASDSITDDDEYDDAAAEGEAVADGGEE
jgi:type I restriction enzyme S subunit